MLAAELDDAFAVIDPGYRALYDRAREVLGADPRVLSVSIGGSVARGTPDPWSDLDLVVVTYPGDHPAFLAEWPRWLADITPTVFARTPIAPFIINSLTPDGLALDVSVWGGPPPDLHRVFNVGFGRFGDHASALEYAVDETLRGLAGPFISYIAREEHVAHMNGVGHVLGLLTMVLLAETGEGPAEGKVLPLTAEQRDVIAALPAVKATRESLTAFSLAVTREVLRRARPLFPRYGLVWPDELERSPARVCGRRSD